MSEEQKQNGAQEEAREHRRSIASFLKWTVLIAVGIPLVWFAFCEARKSYWDWRVTQMCEQDGGLHIEEQLALSPVSYQSLINKFGDLEIPTEARMSGIGVFREDEFVYYRDKDPTVWRYELRVLLGQDRRILGKRVSYARVGGDAIALHSSYFGCPSHSEDLFSAVIRKADQ